ncbi:MAG: aminotransferase class I/II-fold pyridoxal phosphate-dependent enzyme, partial [Albidovulum sp.]|uniref:aminotransferase class I/II-fold pyridoxal phosphate-dependent enzyme n=1 Tax=Albidovulum sp. TaxID=1872424 RepID=UPI003C941A44
DRTHAIVLVTPNNPGGVEYPAEILRAFYDLAKSRGIALIVDETYRDFDARTGAPHDLFTDPDWRGTLIHLYSFSKAYRLTGHRVGAIVADAGRLSEAEKFLDCVAICPSQLGQIGALWGMRNLSQWVAGERDEILARRRAMEAGFTRLPGWTLMGCGAFFAYAAHPHPLPAPELAKRLVREAGILLLPGTMFRPADDPRGATEVRIAFANIGVDGIDEMIRRLAAWTA